MSLRYKLRTLLILLAVLPPLLWVGWTKYAVWKERLAARERWRQALRDSEIRWQQARAIWHGGSPDDPPPVTVPEERH